MKLLSLLQVLVIVLALSESIKGQNKNGKKQPAKGNTAASGGNFGKIICSTPKDKKINMSEPLKGWMKTCTKMPKMPADPSKLTQKETNDLIIISAGETTQCLFGKLGMVNAAGANKVKLANFLSIIPENKRAAGKTAAEKCFQEKGKNLGKDNKKWGLFGACMILIFEMAC